jgi:N-methylhydantoinase A
MGVRLGIDIGGTFTDLVGHGPDGQWCHAKVPSTRSDPVACVLAAIEAAAISPADVDSLALATTIGTNALLERRGARVAYLATEGFEDVPFIGRGNRPRPYDLHWRKPRPFVDRRRCLAVPERVDAQGRVVIPLDHDRLVALERDLSRLVASEELDAVAVNLLFSYLNPSHELEVGRWLAARFPNLSVSLSHEVSPTWREFERAVTTIADAYLKPTLSSFVSRLQIALHSSGFRGRCTLLTSNGGSRLASRAARRPVELSLSGLAGGVIGGTEFGASVGQDLITLDMGGTSCDLALIRNGEHHTARQFDVEFGLPLMFPTIDVSTIGAGGGSIASVDRGGFLRVGPASAGSDPGPACYGRQSEHVTVTDANVVLGRLRSDRVLGGRIALHGEHAVNAIERLARQLGMRPEEAALAVVRIADDNIVNAIRIRTVEEGIDPRDHVLVAFGGAGPLHATSVARRLGVRDVLIPPHPGLCSAYGALIAAPCSDHTTSVYLRTDSIDADGLDRLVRRLTDGAVGELERERGDGLAQVRVSLSARYVGQNYEHEVALPGGSVTPDSIAAAIDDFHSLYRGFYGYAFESEPLEITAVTVTARGFRGAGLPKPHHPGVMTPPILCEAHLDGERTEVRIFERGALANGEELDGPAIVEENDSTTLLQHGDTARVLDDGSLHVQVR